VTLWLSCHSNLVSISSCQRLQLARSETRCRGCGPLCWYLHSAFVDTFVCFPRNNLLFIPVCSALSVSSQIMMFIVIPVGALDFCLVWILEAPKVSFGCTCNGKKKTRNLMTIDCSITIFEEYDPGSTCLSNKKERMSYTGITHTAGKENECQYSQALAFKFFNALSSSLKEWQRRPRMHCWTKRTY